MTISRIPSSFTQGAVTPLAVPYPKEPTPTSQAGQILVDIETEWRLRALESNQVTFQGAYNGAQAYNKNDIITFNNGLYRAIQDVPANSGVLLGPNLLLGFTPDISGFEDGSTGGYTGAAWTIANVTAPAHSGSHSLQLTLNAAGIPFISQLKQLPTIIVGQWYQASYWFYRGAVANTGGLAQTQCNPVWINASNANVLPRLAGPFTPVVNNQWFTAVATAQAPPTTTGMNLLFGTLYGPTAATIGDIYYIDDIALQQIIGLDPAYWQVLVAADLDLVQIVTFQGPTSPITWDGTIANGLGHIPLLLKNGATSPVISIPAGARAILTGYITTAVITGTTPTGVNVPHNYLFPTYQDATTLVYTQATVSSVGTGGLAMCIPTMPANGFMYSQVPVSYSWDFSNSANVIFGLFGGNNPITSSPPSGPTFRLQNYYIQLWIVKGNGLL